MPSSRSDPLDLDGLPGGRIVRRGLADRAAGRTTPEALLVCVARTRFAALGLDVAGRCPDETEHALYELLGRSGEPDPYGRYNALLTELDSFPEAASLRHRRAQGT